jgi:hypothetical protein
MKQEEKNKAPSFEDIVMPHIDLLTLGLDEVGYIKAYKDGGKKIWVLHAANGTAVAVEPDAAKALQSAMHNDLGLVSVH